jgi:hypothetical protein
MTSVHEQPVTKPIHLSALEFDVLIEHLRLDAMPLALKVPSPGRTFTERRQLAAQAWQAMESRGLGRAVGVDNRLERMLQLLANAEYEIDGRFGVSRAVRLVVAAVGEDAVFALLTKEGLSLAEVPVTGLTREAVGVLPVVPAGPGGSVTLRAKDLDAAAGVADTPAAFEVALKRQGVRPPDAALLRVMVSNIKRQGQFGVAARDRWGHRRRGDYVIGFFDTSGGRYLQLRRPGAAGELWSTVSPSDNRLLIASLSDLLDQVRGIR